MIKDQHRFIGDSSHELRTPLTSLKIAIEVALRDKDLSVAEAKTVLKDNLTEINKLQSLSDELLRLAQYDSPEHKKTFSKVSPKKIVELALEEVETLAGNKKITIENKIKNYHIWGNESDLVGLLVILLDNAIKYSPEKTKIELDSKKTRRFVYLSVFDEGVGIPEADIPHIYERFFRSDKSRTGTKGFGLGLSIAKRIVDSHKGTIKVSSEQNKGTQFIIKIPSANNS
jgi:signal transduction histidine kinase